MLLIFEILRETGLRMPTFMGQALIIVSASVIGQAAVEAKFISAPMVIIIALTGITGLMIPKLKGSIIIIRLIFILLSSIIGFYGYMFGIAGLLMHLIEIRTFGIPYMYKLIQISPTIDYSYLFRVSLYFYLACPIIIDTPKNMSNTFPTLNGAQWKGSKNTWSTPECISIISFPSSAFSYIFSMY